MNKNYNLLKNSYYAIEGLIILLKEKAFLIELILFSLMIVFLFFLNVTIVEKLIMFISLMIVLITEALNTAIEYTVDLVTKEWHELAKKAKDVASAAVLLSNIQVAVVWSICLFF